MATEAEIRRQLREAEFSKYQTQAPEEQNVSQYGAPIGSLLGGAIGAIGAGSVTGGMGAPAGAALGASIGGAAGSLLGTPFAMQEEERKQEYAKKLQEEQRKRMLAQGKLMDELAKIQARREAMRRMQQQAQSAASIIA
jgi:outer membrane lipoprotein SlyB